MSDSTSSFAGLYRECGTMGNVGLPGAPIVHFSLLVFPSAGTVSGIVHITQAIAPPNGNRTVSVTGTVHELVFGAQVTKVILLTGEYVQSVPPPAIGSYLVKFTAHMALDSHGNGRGGFEYANNRIENVPVTNQAC